MNELLSQVAKYDKELALINHEKYLQLEMIKADRCKSELQQLDLPSYETMKRRKRKRYEDSTDTSAYIKKHQIFSYYNHGSTLCPFNFIGLEIYFFCLARVSTV